MPDAHVAIIKTLNGLLCRIQGIDHAGRDDAISELSKLLLETDMSAIVFARAKTAQLNQLEKQTISEMNDADQSHSVIAQQLGRCVHQIKRFLVKQAAPPIIVPLLREPEPEAAPPIYRDVEPALLEDAQELSNAQLDQKPAQEDPPPMTATVHAFTRKPAAMPLAITTPQIKVPQGELIYMQQKDAGLAAILREKDDEIAHLNAVIDRLSDAAVAKAKPGRKLLVIPPELKSEDLDPRTNPMFPFMPYRAPFRKTRKNYLYEVQMKTERSIGYLRASLEALGIELSSVECLVTDASIK